MGATLAGSSYGKARIRLVRILRGADQHTLKEMTVSVKLEGGFEDCHTKGDNSCVLPTDTMKNTVFALAKEHATGEIETFALALAQHFLTASAAATRATVDIVEGFWKHVEVGSKPHPHAFERSHTEKGTVEVAATRDAVRVVSGIADLSILKTTDSAFAGFPRDRYTTLPDTSDRILATDLSARWTWKSPKILREHRNDIRRALVETFAKHKSLSVQHTLYAMGEAALAACDTIEDITLRMPNKHCLLVDLKPFGIENRNEVFVATDEPHGVIEGTVKRTT